MGLRFQNLPPRPAGCRDTGRPAPYETLSHSSHHLHPSPKTAVEASLLRAPPAGALPPVLEDPASQGQVDLPCGFPPQTSEGDGGGSSSLTARGPFTPAAAGPP